MGHWKPWTDRELVVLREHGPTMARSEMAKLLRGRSDRTIQEKCRVLGIRKVTPRRPEGQASAHSTYGAYRARAKRAGTEFCLTEEQFSSIVKLDCSYCGSPPQNRRRFVSGDFVYNGLDRIDNAKGYTSDNVTPCCKPCNFMKKAMPLADFKARIYKIYQKLFTQQQER